MTDVKWESRQESRLSRTSLPLLPACLWLVMTVVSARVAGNSSGLVVLLGISGMTASLGYSVWLERRRWVAPLKRLEERIDALTQDPSGNASAVATPRLAALALSLDALVAELRYASASTPPSTAFTLPGDS